MSNKNNNLNDEIDITKLVKKYWDEKYIILGVIFFSTVISYVYPLNYLKKSKEYTSQIILNRPPVDFLLPFSHPYEPQFDRFFQLNRRNNISKLYFSTFKKNIKSLDNLLSFANQNSNIENFKNYLIENNLTMRTYFFNKFGESGKDTYFLNFHESLQGDVFLNEYIDFIKAKTMDSYMREVKLTLMHVIENYEKNLKIAESISIDFPINKKEYLFKSDELYLQGSIILSNQIDNYKKLLILAENKDFDYVHIQESASPPVYSSNSTINAFPFLGFLFGLSLSIIIVFIKKNILKK